MGDCENIGVRFVRHENAAERVRRRIKDWLDAEGRGSRTELADAVTGLYGETRSQSWVTDITQGRQDVRLRDLDALARGIGVPPGDLVRHDDNLYLEVTPSETRVLRFFRSLPDVARHHYLAYLEYIFNLQRQMLEQQAEERDKRTAEAKRLQRVKDSRPQHKRRRGA
jgi:hypothetical protein